MKKLSKKLLSVILSLTMLFSISATAFAADSTTSEVFNNTNAITFSANNITKSDQDFLDKMSKIFDGYVTSETGVIEFTYTDEELTNIGFTQTEIEKLTEINNSICGTRLPAESDTIPSSRIHLKGATVYFTNNDVDAFLFSAAVIGPQALYAALVALGSVSLGPVGTAITAVVGILGAPSLASFCYYVVQAGINDQGVYIGIQMNGIFPIIVSGTW